MSGVTDDLDGKVVVVTGASKGVGRGIARYLAGRGTKLVVSARGAEALGELSAELDDLGAPHIARTGDAADRDSERSHSSTPRSASSAPSTASWPTR